MWSMTANAPMKESRRPYAGFAWLVVVLGPIILFGPMLLRGEALFWGTPLLQFVPWRTYALRVMAEGYLPLWNPLVGMGAPLIRKLPVRTFLSAELSLSPNRPSMGSGLARYASPAMGGHWNAVVSTKTSGAQYWSSRRRLGIFPFGVHGGEGWISKHQCCCSLVALGATRL